MADDPTPEKDNARSYSVCKRYEIDLADSGAITALRDEFGKDATVDVIVRIGRVVKKSPKDALNTLGQKKDLDGEYDVFSDSSVKTFEVATETKREVSVKAK